MIPAEARDTLAAFLRILFVLAAWGALSALFVLWKLGEWIARLI